MMIRPVGYVGAVSRAAPVSPVSAVSRRELDAVRNVSVGNSVLPAFPQAQNDDAETKAAQASGDPSALKRLDQVECQTCSERRYVDGSDDATVSFQTPTRISPDQAATAVRSHEYEHVTNERQNAEREDRKIVSQTVRLFTNVCPECGKTYVSGGETKTTTRADEASGQSNGKKSGGLATPYRSLAVDERT